MKSNRVFGLWLVLTLVGSMLITVSACQQVSAEDIQGLLQAVEGKEIVVKLDDGTMARINVKDDKSLTQVVSLVGRQVDVKVRIKGGQQDLEKVEKRARIEDQTTTGAIQMIDATTARIGGRDFKITATTELDGGLVAGANARVEFITLPDGTLMATQIETDKEIHRVRGGIVSISDDKLVIGGQVFHMDDATHRNGRMAAGDAAHVEFVDDNGVKHVTELELQAENAHFMGTLQAIAEGYITVDGKIFKVNAATVLDNGLAVGVPVRLEFITMADGQLVATEVETGENEVEIEVENEQENEQSAGDDKGGASGSGTSGRG